MVVDAQLSKKLQLKQRPKQLHGNISSILKLTPEDSVISPSLVTSYMGFKSLQTTAVSEIILAVINVDTNYNISLVMDTWVVL